MTRDEKTNTTTTTTTTNINIPSPNNGDFLKNLTSANSEITLNGVKLTGSRKDEEIKKLLSREYAGSTKQTETLKNVEWFKTKYGQ